jgi:hypothetical protein
MLKTGSKMVVLGSAVGMPYVFSNSGALRDKLYDTWGKPSTVEVAQLTPWQTQPGQTAGQNPLTGGDAIYPTPGAAPYGGAPAGSAPSGTGEAPQAAWAPQVHSARLDPVELRPLADVLRFDVTTAWVLANWARVSTALADVHLQGYRVSLITGTNEGDLAGALTYYFNPQQQVQRIVFQGTTGDARPLVEHLSKNFHFVREITPDPRQFVFTAHSGRNVTGQLRIRPVSVVRRDESQSRFEVGLVMERPTE